MGYPYELPITKEVTDRELNPPEPGEWTEREKSEAVDNLVDALLAGLAWDENLESYKSDMFADWESIMLRTDIDKDEAWALIRDAQLDYMKMWAKEQVENDPYRYCETDEDGYFGE